MAGGGGDSTGEGVRVGEVEASRWSLADGESRARCQVHAGSTGSWCVSCAQLCLLLWESPVGMSQGCQGEPWAL